MGFFFLPLLPNIRPVFYSIVCPFGVLNYLLASEIRKSVASRVVLDEETDRVVGLFETTGTLQALIICDGYSKLVHNDRWCTTFNLET